MNTLLLLCTFVVALVGSVYANSQAIAEVQTCAGLSEAELVATPLCNVAHADNEAVACSASGVTGETWLEDFKDCLVEAAFVQNSYCACYKEFISAGLRDGCHNAQNSRYVAAQGVRFGVGPPAFTSGNCGLETNGFLNGTLYNGPGTLFTAQINQTHATGDVAANVAASELCVPACSGMCELDMCSDASIMAPTSMVAAVVVAAWVALF